MLSKVQINLPLLELVSNVPSYAKFFKEVCSRKRKFNVHEKVQASVVVNLVLQHNLPPKMKDPGSFNIHITIGDGLNVKAMLDLGANINLMPYSVYRKLNLGTLKETSIFVQLADRSIKFPKGIVEDLLVQVDKLIVPVDFIVMDMESSVARQTEPVILLGRPFMATTKTVIDVHNGKLSMNVLGETIQFEVFKMPLTNAKMIDECFAVDEFDSCIEEFNMKMIDDISMPLVAFNGLELKEVDEQWFDALLEDDTNGTNDGFESLYESFFAGNVSEESSRAREDSARFREEKDNARSRGEDGPSREDSARCRV